LEERSRSAIAKPGDFELERNARALLGRDSQVLIDQIAPGRPIGQVIDELSGSTGGKGNASQYATKVAKSIGLSPSDPITPALLQSPAGIQLAKTQAHWEAGQSNPMTDDQWQQAQSMRSPNNNPFLIYWQRCRRNSQPMIKSGRR
jgi:hypothetical protein